MSDNILKLKLLHDRLNNLEMYFCEGFMDDYQYTSDRRQTITNISQILSNLSENELTAYTKNFPDIFQTV